MSGYSPEEVVTSLYRILLGREPDPGGYADHLNSMQQGTPLAVYSACVFNGARSAEARPDQAWDFWT